jgi:hypothetical protein
MGAEFTWAYAITFGSRKQQSVPAAAPPVPSQATQKQPDQNLVEAKQAAMEEALDKRKENGTPKAKN